MHDSAYQSTSMRSAEEARREFAACGVSIAAWARAHGYSPQLVYQVLSGRKACLRGQCHRIAVDLGMKRGRAGSLGELDDRLRPRESGDDVTASRREGEAMS